jgi:hypothetical protein
MSDLTRHYYVPVPDAVLDLHPFSIQFVCHPHTTQLVCHLGGKEVGGLLVLKEKKQKEKEYNLLYLLAEVRTT